MRAQDCAEAQLSATFAFRLRLRCTDYATVCLKICRLCCLCSEIKEVSCYNGAHVISTWYAHVMRPCSCRQVLRLSVLRFWAVCQSRHRSHMIQLERADRPCDFRAQQEPIFDLRIVCEKHDCAHCTVAAGCRKHRMQSSRSTA